VLAKNVRKGAKFLTLYGLPDPASTGWLRQKHEDIDKNANIKQVTTLFETQNIDRKAQRKKILK
jgi:hypothetical protein